MGLNQKNYITGFVILFLLIGCNSENSPSEIRKNGTYSHPINEYIPYVEHSITIPKTVPSDPTSKDQDMDYAPVVDSDFKLRIGGDINNAFGRISGAVKDSKGNIIILDGDQPSIKKYSSNGDLLFSYNNEGRGPEDLLEPSDIEIDNDDYIYIANRLNYIKVFRSESDSIAFDRSISTDQIPVGDLCLLNDKIFIRSLGQNQNYSDSTVYNMVHVFSNENDDYLKSFGEPYKSSDLRLSSGGKIECNAKTNMIAYSFEYFPFLYGYTASGEFKWAAKLSNFNGSKIEEEVKNGRSIRFSFSKIYTPTSDNISGLSTLNNDYLSIQNKWSKRNEGSSNIIDDGITTYILDFKTGELKTTLQELPLISYLDKEHLIEHAFGPNIHPHINIYQLGN